MKKFLSVLFFSVTVIGLAACGNEAENKASGDLPETSDLPTHSQLADSMAITEATLGKVMSATDQLVDTQLNEKEVLLTFQLNDEGSVDELKSVVDDVLMDISNHTVDSNELSDGYATVYDFYDVVIKIVDPNENVIHEGKMYADQDQTISWS